MSDFSSLNKGESLLAGNKKNDSLACKKGGGDAAKIAGAAIAGVAVAGALAVGASQTSLFSSGVGASGATQTAATNSISSASSGVSSATGSAQSKATTAITQGPGAQSNATLNSAQGDVNGAQADASQLAGEKRAGADGQVAQSQASVNNAQSYLASQTAAGQANASAEKTLLSGKVNSALATAPPPPAGLAKPAAGQLPTAPLPVNVPPPEKATDQSVAVPPSNLAIQTPASASVPTAKITPSSSTQQTVQQEQLKQTALSKDELDACAAKRTQMTNAFDTMSNGYSDSITALALIKEKPKKVSSGFLGLGSTIQHPGAYLVYNALNLGSSFYSGFRGSLNFYIDSKNADPEMVKKLNSGYVGSSQFVEMMQSAKTEVEYFLKCDELSVLTPIVAKQGELLSLVNQLATVASTYLDTSSVSETTTFLRQLFPVWDKINQIVLLLPDKYLKSGHFSREWVK